MLETFRELISSVTDLMAAVIWLASLIAVATVAFRTKFALVAMAGIVFVVYFVNWAIGNVDWAKSKFDEDVSDLSLGPAVVLVVDMADRDRPELLNRA